MYAEGLPRNHVLPTIYGDHVQLCAHSFILLIKLCFVKFLVFHSSVLSLFLSTTDLSIYLGRNRRPPPRQQMWVNIQASPPEVK
jgi:hypothetical protein